MLFENVAGEDEVNGNDEFRMSNDELELSGVAIELYSGPSGAGRH